MSSMSSGSRETIHSGSVVRALSRISAILSSSPDMLPSVRAKATRPMTAALMRPTMIVESSATAIMRWPRL
jgi:hypothetical protein